jgi:1-phosphofructokinase
MARILVAGLNPAWQKVLSLPPLQPGQGNRAGVSWSLASGKGINSAKALARLGHDVSVLQILAGENGRRCQEACGKWNLRSLHVRTRGETRECITLLSGEDGCATEIIEPFTVTDPGLTQQLLGRIDINAAYDAVMICGTVPNGVPESIYGDILGKTKTALVLWDSVTGLTPELLKRISWIKVNAEEFARLSTMAEASWPAVLLTEGPNPARVLHSHSADGTYRLPPLAKMRNPIGAGDTVNAALMDGLLRGLNEEAAVRRALAFGMASCLSPLPAEFDPAEAQALEAKIRKDPS